MYESFTKEQDRRISQAIFAQLEHPDPAVQQPAIDALNGQIVMGVSPLIQLRKIKVVEIFLPLTPLAVFYLPGPSEDKLLRVTHDPYDGAAVEVVPAAMQDADIARALHSGADLDPSWE